MPSPPKLSIPDSAETVAFRCIDTILRGSPDIVRVFRTVVSWRGDDIDGEDPTASMCPYLMIVPGGRQSGWVSEGQHEEPMQVGILIAVEGSDADQLMNLWGLIRSTLFPQDLTKMAAVQTATTTAGITCGTLTAPAFSVNAKEADDATLLAAMGTLELYLMIST